MMQLWQKHGAILFSDHPVHVYIDWEFKFYEFYNYIKFTNFLQTLKRSQQLYYITFYAITVKSEASELSLSYYYKFLRS